MVPKSRSGISLRTGNRDRLIRVAELLAGLYRLRVLESAADLPEQRFSALPGPKKGPVASRPCYSCCRSALVFFGIWFTLKASSGNIRTITIGAGNS
jgi:hypothetical protein